MPSRTRCAPARFAGEDLAPIVPHTALVGFYATSSTPSPRRFRIPRVGHATASGSPPASPLMAIPTALGALIADSSLALYTAKARRHEPAR
jgi:hypothetical protein